ncbi:MAG: DnaJ domain-containing protein [Helicobacteraceae bacterium]|jgi:hypothetical protein|nr:DnaJ domain-containing protein [Helicobacteraceae bacterium]
MTVVLHMREVRVYVEEGSINHMIIKNFTTRYFSSALEGGSLLLIPHKESEVSQKRYFFQWLYSAYKKKRSNLTPSFLKMLQSAIGFPIAVHIKQRAKPVQSIAVRLWLPSPRSFIISVEPAGSLAVNLLHQKFMRHIERRLAKNQFEIGANEESLCVLSELFSRTQILAQPVIFMYDKASIDALLNRAKETKQKQRFFRLVIEEDAKLKEAYRFLGVAENAEAETIKRAYRTLALRYHPDRVYDHGERVVAEHTNRFFAVNEAYELIAKSLANQRAAAGKTF